MDELHFEWDDAKARINVSKHGVTFQEAATAFLDPYARVIDDPEHSDMTEERLILMGISTKARLLVVVHCQRETRNTIWIISARKASKYESQQYGRFYDAR
ncbi:Ribonuclease toxin, BrnT, of type II toxin-antitoxin system [Bifidobacterium sp. DSM 109958]|uniref:Ribonuclease toxin, BrnT, of type II toxin-antitoxin system n=1 Tax=Bifidobacterium moraviense TaxID=2675323 RepID=A0A7Y0F3H7_9BIFI|nr:BrnT family toxin [Bifidobacterium sp. DSM 109958]NMN01365.1 Ribonuclease toxin, BrnT, of type II toxin-antitoxin system [Bifidobacterium sp. DSM 109958]